MSQALIIDASEAVPPDPRKWVLMRVGDLVIDHRIQRTRTDSDVQHIVREFDWRKFEAPTVMWDHTLQHYLVLEGQKRILALQALDADTEVTVAVLPAQSIADAADVAYEIARTRRPHSAWDSWRMRVLRGDQHEILAERILAQRGLHLGLTPSMRCIAAVATVKTIVHHYRDPEAGANHLDDVLSTVLAAYPNPDPESPHARFDHNLLAALSLLLRHNGDRLNRARLSAKLNERPAQYWLADLSITPEPRPMAIARVMMRAYNKTLRSNVLELP